MASESWPNAAHNSGAVTTVEWEQLAHQGMGTGVLGLPSDTTVVFADGTGTRTVYVRAGKRAVVRGAAWHAGASNIALTLAANTSGLTRVDLIVLRLTRSTGVVAEAVVQGTAGAGAPALTQDAGTTGVWEMPLAQVTVVNGATTLAAGTVSPLAWYLGDGVLVCTTGTRPTHAPGRLIWETDTGRLLVSTGVAWMRVYDDSGASAWVMRSGFTAQSNVLRRRNGFVTGQLSFRRSTTMTADTSYQVASVPSGFAPSEPLDLVGTVLGLTLSATAEISTGGVLTVRVADTVAVGEIRLHPVTWPVA